MVYGWRCAARRATATTHNQHGINGCGGRERSTRIPRTDTRAALASPTTVDAVLVVGDASAARVSVLGILGTATTTAIADTGTLSGVNDARDASMVTGSVPSTLSAETLRPATISWADQVDSEASLANLNMTVAGAGITADSVVSQASQGLGAAGTAGSIFTN